MKISVISRQEETETLLHWIDSGAANTSGSDPLAARVHEAPEWELVDNLG